MPAANWNFDKAGLVEKAHGGEPTNVDLPGTCSATGSATGQAVAASPPAPSAARQAQLAGSKNSPSGQPTSGQKQEQFAGSN